MRIGAYVGDTTVSIGSGTVASPNCGGRRRSEISAWRLDTQDSPVVPAGGVLSNVRLTHIFSGPDLAVRGEALDVDTAGFGPAVCRRESFLEHRSTASRLPVRWVRHILRFGTIADQSVLARCAVPAQCLRHRRTQGAHCYVATAGYLRRVGRLPDFMGGAVFAGGWLENGHAFDEWTRAGWKVNGGVGLVMDTIIGPVVLAGSWSFDGRWCTYLGVGRMFRAPTT